ncbi:MAG: protein kinase [Planctomycetota bacterium]|nr:protein kinase [Planctomycetota bacterium]
MSEDPEARIYALYQEALAADDPEPVLARCGPLRDAVEELLQSSAQAEASFLAVPALERLATLEPGTAVGRYEVVRRIGGGGGGRVYEAIQQQPRRRVALKLMRHVDERFEKEAQVLAQLDHPGIAAVYEAGRHEGATFVALQFVEGDTLDAWSRGKSLEARLALLAHVCDAVEHGHERRVIHRDLKPANILVGESGPKVIDFGIAATTDEGASAAGTPGFMAPEQEAGAPVDARTDVYALGALLGRLVRGQAIASKGRQADLEAIIGKATASKRGDRYPSAAMLAADIRRLLSHAPVSARRAPPPHRVRLFARRHPALATTLVALVLTVGVAVAMSSGFARDAAVERSAALSEREAHAVTAYIRQIALAHDALRDHDVAEAGRRLDDTPEHLRGWEWRHLHAGLDHAERVLDTGIPMFWGAASRERNRIVAVGEAGGEAAALRMRDLATGEARTWRFEATQLLCVGLSPDGRLAAMGTSDGRILLVDLDAAGDDAIELKGPSTHVNDVRFDPRGKRVVGAYRDGVARVWMLATRTLERELRGHADRVICAAFEPEGGVLTGCRDGTLCLYPGDGSPRRWRAHDGSVEGLAFSPDGTEVATCSRDRTVRVFDLATTAQRLVADGHQDNVRSIAWAGQTIATASYDRTVRLWRARDLSALALLRGHTNLVRHVAFVDDDTIASFSPDATVRLWPVGSRGHARSLGDARSPVQQVLFDDDHTVTATRAGHILWWDPAGDVAKRLDAFVAIDFLALAGDAQLLRLANGRLFTRHADGRETEHTARSGGPVAWNSVTGTLYWTSGPRVYRHNATEGTTARTHHDARIAAMVAGPGKGAMASVDEDGGITSWSGARPVVSGLLTRSGARAMAASPDGKLLAVAHEDGSILLVARKDLKVLHVLEGHAGAVRGVAFHPREPRLASGSEDETVRLWDTRTGEQVVVLRPGIRIHSVAFDASGGRLAAAGGAESGTQAFVWLAGE